MIRFVIVGMMNTQSITQLVLAHAAELTGVIVSLTNISLQRLAKAGRISFARNTAAPSGIILSGQCASDSETPFAITRIFLSSFACRLSHFWRPCSGYFCGDTRALTSLKRWFRLPLQSLTHTSSMFCGALIGWAIMQELLMAIRAAFDTSANRITAVDTQIRLAIIDLFRHGLTSIV